MKRLFLVSLIVTVGVMGIYMTYGFIIGYHWPVQLVYTSGFVIYTILLILFKRGFSFRLLSLTYYYVVISLVIAAWIPSGGLQGAIIRFVVLIFISGLMVLKLRDFLGFCLLLTGVVATFSYLEYAGFVQPPEYTDHKVLLLDLFITNITMLLIIWLALYFFKREYLLDKYSLRETNRELEKEKVNAQAADKAKTEFLATISHEMRTPLNGIVGISDLLKETPLDRNQRELIEKLTYSSNLLNHLISDVLDLSLIESGKLMFKEESFQLEPELKEIMNLVRPRLRDKGDRVKLNLRTNAQISANLVADIKRIRQILINLLVNAIKYTEEGSVTLQVDVVNSDESGVLLKFSVIDTGIGIPEERQGMLFSKFYKAHEQSSVEGTGLGLSIAKSLAEHMGGSIWFKSEYGKGSTFFFSIPLKLDIEHRQLEPTRDLPLRDYSKLSVLVAEDQEINMMVAKRMLESLGISDIGLARDGAEVVERARERAYDIILMDVQMPKKNGIQATRELSSTLTGKKPVIIALTANVLKEDVEACLKAGMQDFISKPFKKDHLVEIFEKHLS